MKIFRQLFLAALLPSACAISVRAAGGDEVVVVFNSRLPESRAVADYYASKRAVPAGQVFGFDLPTDETISRAVFRDELQKPLAKKIAAEKLWRISSEILTGTNAASGRVLWKVTDSKIRYLVLCHGVPLHIAEDTTLVEPGTESLRPEMKRNEAAVDSELTCLPALEDHYRVTGPLRNPFYTTTNAADLHPTNGILLVARLDGPTPAVARGLVDKALEAEANGLWGRAYFDLRGITDTNYVKGDEWLMGAAGIARLFGYETIMDTNAATFPASFPMSHIAFYAGWYDGDVSGPFAQPQVEFMPGAFAYHLHSFSAATLRSTNQNWCGPLLARGAACTMGCVAEPYLPATPDIGTFFGRLCVYGFNFAQAAWASQPALSWQTTVVGDPLYHPFMKTLRDQHADLERRHSPLLEWSYLKLANYYLLQRTSPAQVLNYIETIPILKESPQLNEKRADLNALLGKPASAIRDYRAALALATSPLQRVRLRLAIGEQLLARDQPADALENYRQLLAENSAWPGRAELQKKIAALETAAATNAPAK